jgi:hypothetical protein
MKNWLLILGFVLFVSSLVVLCIWDAQGQTPPSVTLTWMPSPTPGVVYDVYRTTAKKIPACPGGVVVATNLPGTAWTDLNVKAKQTYYYNVASYNSNGKSCSAYEMQCFVRATGRPYICTKFTTPPIAPDKLKAVPKVTPPKATPPKIIITGSMSAGPQNFLSKLYWSDVSLNVSSTAGAIASEVWSCDNGASPFGENPAGGSMQSPFQLPGTMPTGSWCGYSKTGTYHPIVHVVDILGNTASFTTPVTIH